MYIYLGHPQHQLHKVEVVNFHIVRHCQLLITEHSDQSFSVISLIFNSEFLCVTFACMLVHVCVYIDLYEIGKLFNVHVSVSFLLLLPSPEHTTYTAAAQNFKIERLPIL